MPGSVVGLPAIPILPQGAAETPHASPALLLRDARGWRCCWDLSVPSKQMETPLTRSGARLGLMASHS